MDLLQIAVYVLTIATLVFFIYLHLRGREVIDGLREHSAGLLKALQKERDKVDTLRKDITAFERRIRELDAELTKIKQDYEPSTRLSRKLNAARATGEQQDARLKHQNNEMRVAMSRTYRYLNGLGAAIRRTEKELGTNFLDIRNAAGAALAEWTLINNWLTDNNIAPYLGDVPGYDGQKASEREEGLAPTV